MNAMLMMANALVLVDVNAQRGNMELTVNNVSIYLGNTGIK
jgi:hypothetical protein